ncbi:MAG: DUF3825 domain-containing protein, partial [Chromatiaceae bacterium]|nr:DUF3825 domain-containing protein [Chromatiaceae bacterium]
DALCIPPPRLRDLRPLRPSGGTLAPTPSGDYRPSLRSPWPAALDEHVFFRFSWYRGTPKLLVRDRVEFHVKHSPDGRPQAKNLTREGENREGLRESSGQLLEWAYIGNLPQVLEDLKSKALRERWEFRRQPEGDRRPFPILFNYLKQTFSRLQSEAKVLTSEDGKFAAFNTGLVDDRYESIHALFERNRKPGTMPWWLRGFCTPGESGHGQDLVRHFNPLPDRAHYFENPSDLLYDVRQPSPEYNLDHIINERIHRFPSEFLQHYLPRSIIVSDPFGMNESEMRAYEKRLSDAVMNERSAYMDIKNRIDQAIKLAIKRVTWNFKTAVPQYYPKTHQLQLLLPLCLASADHVDLAFAVERGVAGAYLGHTVLPLDWAYSNARLICRPDSDWLEPTTIDVQDVDDEASLADGLSTY